MTVPENLISTPKSITPLAHRATKTAMVHSSGRAYSRSELMLKAALGVDHKSIKITDNDTMMSGVEVRNKMLLTKQTSSQKKRNKVIFCDPPVSNSFAYEPTVLLEYDNNLTANSNTDSREPLEGDLRQAEKMKEYLRKIEKRSKERKTVPQSNKLKSDDEKQNDCRQSNTENVECHLDDHHDSDDDEFTLAPTTFFSETLPVQPTSPRKRPYELTIQGIDDSTSNCSNPEQENGCLFSPPKVAKVAPYYREPTKAKPQLTDLKTSHASAVRSRFFDFVYFLFR